MNTVLYSAFTAMFRFPFITIQASSTRFFMVTVLITNFTIHSAWSKHTYINFFWHFHGCLPFIESNFLAGLKKISIPVLRKSQAKNAVLFQQTILRYFVHFGQHEKATRQSPAGSLCFIVLFLCYFRVLCVRFSLKYERTGAARPPPPSTRPAPCSHSARLKPSLGSCSSRFGFARSPPVIPRRASSLSGATAE